MNEEKRSSLVKRLEKFLDDQECYTPSPLVSLDQFFDGNDDVGSIGCNLFEHPGIQRFRDLLSELEEHEDISKVWVIAKQHDWKPGWPHSDEVIFLTSLNVDTIEEKISILEPDEVYDVYSDFKAVDLDNKAISAQDGEKFIGAWWD